MGKWKSVSASTKAQLLETPCEAVLSYFGCRTDHNGNMFFNPFRDERTPSMHISKDNKFFLHSEENFGGGVTDLCKYLMMHRGIIAKGDDSCFTNQELAIRRTKIWETLGLVNGISNIYDENITFSSNILQKNKEYSRQRRTVRESAIHIVSPLQPLTDISLVKYLESRGIRRDIIEQSHQITVRYGDNPKEYILIAEERIEDGKYYLRGIENWNKKSNGGSFSIVTREGQRLKEADMATYTAKNNVIVFEGEIDYKSWMSNLDKKNIFDYIILNSTVNAEKIIPFISGYKKVNLCLDNDDAGRKATSVIISLLNRNENPPTIEDRSNIYATYKKSDGTKVQCKDYSEYHTAHWKDEYHEMVINDINELLKLRASIKNGQQIEGPNLYISKIKFI